MKDEQEIMNSIRNFQMESLGVLKELIRICDSIGVDYWVHYGTLIGAIRHKGFIPWDDDIDVGMKRKDFEKLFDFLTMEYKSTDFKLDYFTKHNNYPFYIPRFCENKQVYFTKGYKYCSGAFVDIYPFDGMGNESDMDYWRNNYKNIRFNIRCLLMSRRNSILFGSTRLHRILNVPLFFMCKIVGGNHFYKKLDSYEKRFSWDESKYVDLICWDSLRFFEKSWFEDIIEVPFEDITVKVPAGYDKLLTCIYGDYMTVPNVNYQVPHHDIRKSDLSD